MDKKAVSLLALMLGIGNTEFSYADALSALRKLNLVHNPSTSTPTVPSTPMAPSTPKTTTSPISNQAAVKASSNNDAELQKEITRLKAQILELQQALKTSSLQKGLSSIDPRTEEKVKEEVQTYTSQLTTDLKDKTKNIDLERFREILENVETSGSPEALLALEASILEQTQIGDNAARLEGVNIILEKSDALKKLTQQRQKAHFEYLATYGQQRLNELTSQLKADPSYFKKSPFSILVFMNKNTFDFSIVQRSLSTLMSQFKKAPQSDIQAIYSYLHAIGIDPQRTSGAATFMQTVGQMIDSSKTGGNGLSEADFTKLLKTNRQQLVDLINNINNSDLKDKLLKLISIGENAQSKATAAKPALELTSDPRAVIYFKALNEIKNIPSLDEQTAIVGANAIIDKLNAKPNATSQEKASAAIDNINSFLTAKMKKSNLTENEKSTVREAITTLKANVPQNAGPTLPPPPPPSSAKNNSGKTYSIGAEIPTDKDLKNNILATLKGKGIEVQTAINSNKNKAHDIQTKLNGKKAELELDDETILASAYAALTAPAGTLNPAIRKRIANTINPTMKTAFSLEATLKEVYP